MTVFSVAGLVFLLVAIPVLICSAHIPGLRELTGAAPLEDERCRAVYADGTHCELAPHDDATRHRSTSRGQIAEWGADIPAGVMQIARNLPPAPAPRVADRPSQMPHRPRGHL